MSGAFVGRFRSSTTPLGSVRRSIRGGARRPTQAYYLRRADLLARLGDRRGADRERDRAAGLEPTTAVDEFLVADQWYKRGDLERAALYFAAALRSRPDHFWAQFFRAACHLRLGRPSEAEAGLTACLGRRPGFLWSYVYRGLAEGELGRFEAAEADFRTALGLAPSREAQYSIYVNRGVVRMRRGAIADAVADLEHAGALLPDQYQAHVDLTQAYRAQGRFDKAAEQLGQAIRLEPTLASLYRQRAQLALERGDSAAALRDLNQAIRCQPPDCSSSAEDHDERGRILYGDGRYQDVIAACDAALRVRPDDPPAHLLRARALLELRCYEEAVRSCDRYLERGTPTADVFQTRGHAREQLGDNAGAVEDYTRALELAPDAEMHILRGWSYMLLDSWKLALRDFEEAVRLDPRSSDAYNGRGYTLAKLDRYREAVVDAEEALRLEPQSPEMIYGIACTFALATSKAEADGGQPDRYALGACYRGRALELIRRALDRLPADRRRQYWREVMLPNDDLDPIRHCPEFSRLEAEFSEPAK